ncbi:MAG TPA: MFS transporter [Jatrophihabitans sp.]|nr:MFS transporter [Jatrophihabitans sp.]
MRKWLPLAAICCGTFMLLIDVTVVNVALPAMARSLDTSFAALQWVVDAYALSLCSLLLGIGSVADKLGHRRAYVASLALFAVASLACGLAPNAGVLIGSRAAQGIGAAGMFACTYALLSSSYQGRDRGVAYGLWGAVVGASAAVGPIIGGLLTQGLSWRWIFFINLPVSAVAIVLSQRVLSGARHGEDQRIDLPGMALFTVAAAALTFGLIRANNDGWLSAPVLGLIAGSAVALVLFILVESRSPAAMLDLSLLRRPAFVGILVGSFLANFAAFSSFAYTSLWLQSVLGLGPIAAGATGLPLSAASFFVSAGIGRFLHSRAPGPIIGTGILLIGLGGLTCALQIGPHSNWTALLIGFVLIGIGVGLSTPTLSSSAMATVPLWRGGMAAGAVTTMRQLGFTLGVAVLGTLFATRARQQISDAGVPNAQAVAHGLTSGQGRQLLDRAGPARSTLSAVLRSAAASGIDLVFWVSAAGGVLGAILVFLLVRPSRERSPAAELEQDTAAASA